MRINTNCFTCNTPLIRYNHKIGDSKKYFCSKQCFYSFKRKGHINKSGYRIFKIKSIAYKEHRINMEKFLKRKLTSNEIVHHVNENKLDNRIQNLIIVSRRNHAMIHFPLSWDIEMAKKLRQKKWSFKRIAKEMNITRQAITSAFKKRNLSTKYLHNP